MDKNLIKFILTISLCFFCCLVATAKTETQPPIKQKGIFSNSYEKIKELGRSYKTKLEIEYYKNKLKETPNNVEVLKEYAEFLKNHKYYGEAIKIYNRLIELTKDEKYKTDISQIEGYWNDPMDYYAQNLVWFGNWLYLNEKNIKAFKY